LSGQTYKYPPHLPLQVFLVYSTSEYFRLKVKPFLLIMISNNLSEFINGIVNNQLEALKRLAENVVENIERHENMPGF
jgi:hypothetical protein